MLLSEAETHIIGGVGGVNGVSAAGSVGGVGAVGAVGAVDAVGGMGGDVNCFVIYLMWNIHICVVISEMKLVIGIMIGRTSQ